MAVTSLRTSYAGCYFRSRLEARWAVFMDHAEIKWEYEPTWLQLSTGRFGRPYNWLPDFRLYNGCWAEVKGQLSMKEYKRLFMMAYIVGGPNEEGCGGGQDVVVLGHLPQPASARWPVQLHVHDRKLYPCSWSLGSACPLTRPHYLSGDFTADLLLSGMLSGQPEWAEPALSYARWARFEHQSG